MKTEKTQYQKYVEMQDKFNAWLDPTEMINSKEYTDYIAQREIDCQKAFDKLMQNPFYSHLKEIGYNIMLNPNASYDSIERISIVLNLAYSDREHSIFKTITENVYLNEL